nr:MAG TPA: hypothetical protein [Caudoviricetes sp.]
MKDLQTRVFLCNKRGLIMVNSIIINLLTFQM